MLKLLFRVQEEHREDQNWFRNFEDENNHQKTDLISKVAANIAQNTTVMEVHTKTLEKLMDKIDRIK